MFGSLNSYIIRMNVFCFCCVQLLSTVEEILLFFVLRAVLASVARLKLLEEHCTKAKKLVFASCSPLAPNEENAFKGL